jgi:hypothetical protein
LPNLWSQACDLVFRNEIGGGHISSALPNVQFRDNRDRSRSRVVEALRPNRGTVGHGLALLKRPSADVVDGAISLFERQRSSGLGPVETDFELHPAIETSEPNQALTATLGGL